MIGQSQNERGDPHTTKTAELGRHRARKEDALFFGPLPMIIQSRKAQAPESLDRVDLTTVEPPGSDAPSQGQISTMTQRIAQCNAQRRPAVRSGSQAAGTPSIRAVARAKTLKSRIVPLCQPDTGSAASSAALASATRHTAAMSNLRKLRDTGMIDVAEFVQMATELLEGKAVSTPVSVHHSMAAPSDPFPGYDANGVDTLADIAEIAAAEDGDEHEDARVRQASQSPAILSTPGDPEAALAEKKRQESRMTANLISKWALRQMTHARSFTTVALARLLHAIARDGRLDEKDEQAVQELLAKQQQVWNIMLVILTLLIGILAPMTADIPESFMPESNPFLDPPLDETVAKTVLQAYAACLALAFNVAFFQLFLTAMFYVLTTYLDDTRDIVWFFFTFRRWVVFINFAIIPLAPLLMGAVCCGITLLHGVISGCIAAGLGLFSIIVLLYSFLNTQGRLLKRFRMPIVGRSDEIFSIEQLPMLPAVAVKFISRETTNALDDVGKALGGAVGATTNALTGATSATTGMLKRAATLTAHGPPSSDAAEALSEAARTALHSSHSPGHGPGVQPKPHAGKPRVGILGVAPRRKSTMLRSRPAGALHGSSDEQASYVI